MTPEQVLNLVGVVATISLGVVSIALGAFAIWLSRHFDTKSSQALDAIKDVAREIKTTAELSVAHQQSFSTKMLDSILARDQYGRSQADQGHQQLNFEKVIQDKLDATEKKIAASVEGTVRQLLSKPAQDQGAVNNAITEIRKQIQALKGAALAATTSDGLPSSIRKHLEDFKRHPAHFALLAAIIEGGARSEAQVNSLSSRYHIPEPVESGLRNLRRAGILMGRPTSFDIKPELLAPMKVWLDANREPLNRLIRHYSDNPDAGLTDTERAIGMHFVADDR